jgi:hypothetical protein
VPILHCGLVYPLADISYERPGHGERTITGAHALKVFTWKMWAREGDVGSHQGSNECDDVLHK